MILPKGAKLEDIQPPALKSFAEEVLQTPNVSRGRVIKPRGIVFHHSCGSWAGDTNWILSTKSQVSYHCLINANGNRRIFADDTQRAWHAGRSSFKGMSDCNSFTLGVAFSGDTYPGRPYGRLLTNDEIASAVEYVLPRMKRWGIDASWVTDHRQVSPGRKNDLNPSQFERVHAAIVAALK